MPQAERRHHMVGDREPCLAAGMDDCVSKPISITDLFAAIERLVPAASQAYALPSLRLLCPLLSGRRPPPAA